jgi:hypothetical protein
MILEIAAQKEHNLALSWMCSHLCGIITPRAVASCLRVMLEHVLQSVFLLFLALALKKPFMLGLHDNPLSAPVDACMDFVAGDENLHFREELLVGVRVLTREVIEGAVGLQLNC